MQVHPAVAADLYLYRQQFGGVPPATVGELVRGMAAAVLAVIDDGNHAVEAYLTNWHPDFDARTPDVLREALARGHGFASWAAAEEAGDRPLDPLFEASADAVVAGATEQLAGLLARSPELARQRSPLGHAATLLHYVAANGVEFRRQMSGPGAPAVAEQLLTAGAQVDALADTYGGGTGQTTLVLLLTSGHPRVAGVTNAVVSILLRHGADPNGVDGDRAPVAAAIRTGNETGLALLAAAGAR